MVTYPDMAKDIHVLVVGAGATGLLIAHGLKKAGIRTSVFEHEVSSQAYRPREWTMGIHWALPLLVSLLPEDMKPRLGRETYVDPSLEWEKSPCDHLRMFNGETGGILKDIPVKGKIVRVSRRKLRTFLAEGIDVQYNHQLVDMKYDTDGVTAIFANGSEVRGTLVVGCDGPKSAVRDFLLGREKAAAQPLSGVIHYNTHFCPGDAKKARFLRAAHPVFAMTAHPDIFCFTSILNVPDTNKPETWHFQVLGGWLGEREDFPDAASRMKELKRRGRSLPEPFRSAIEWLPQDIPVTYDLLNYWVSTPWDTRGGQATLAGDAAHPMPPHRGQGLNHAIQDAYNFVNLLTNPSRSNSSREGETVSFARQIQDYSDEVASRGAEEVKLSKQSAMMALDWSLFRESPFMKHGVDRSPEGAMKNPEVSTRDDSDKEKEAKIARAIV